MTVDTIRTGVLAERPANDPLAGWLDAASDAQTLAQGLVRSFFVPQAYKPNPREEGAYEVAVANATGAILLGRSLGLDPLTSLQQIYVVHGRPGMYTKLKVALAQAAGHRVWDEEYGPERAVVCGQRKGTEDVVRVEITMEMAKTAGWTDNAAYRKTPADMLWARAAARVVDRIAADLLMGIRSIEDIEPDEARAEVTVTPEAPRARAAAILAAAVPAQAPATAPVEVSVPVDPAPPAPAPQEPAQRLVMPAGKRQLDAIGARFGELGLGGRSAAVRADRLACVAHIVEREITDPSDLTGDEARKVLDELSEDTLRAVLDRAAALDAQPAPKPAVEDVDQALADWPTEPAGGER